MISRYNRTSLRFGIPGLLLQFVVPIAASMIIPQATRLQQSSVLVGTVLVLIGLAYYAIAKGRSPWWCLLGFLSWIGYLVLAQLADKSSERADGNAEP